MTRKFLQTILFTALVISSLLFTSTLIGKVNAAPALDWSGSSFNGFPDGFNDYDSNAVIVPVDGADNDVLIQLTSVNGTGPLAISYATINETTGAIGSVTTAGFTLDMGCCSKITASFAELTTGDKFIYVSDGISTGVGRITLNASGIPTAATVFASELIAPVVSPRIQHLVFGGLDYLYWVYDDYFGDTEKYETMIESCDLDASGDIVTCYELARRDTTILIPDFIGGSEYAYIDLGTDQFFIGVGGFFENLTESSTTNKIFGIKVNSDGYIGDLEDIGYINVDGIAGANMAIVGNDIYVIGGHSYYYDLIETETTTPIDTTIVLEGLSYNSGTENLEYVSINSTNQEVSPFEPAELSRQTTQVTKGDITFVYHTKYVVANSRYEVFPAIIDSTEAPAPDTTGPVFNFTSSYSGTNYSGDLGVSFDFTFSTTDAETPIQVVQYQINEGGYSSLTPLDAAYGGELSEDFNLTLLTVDYEDLGNQTIDFKALDDLNNETIQSYTFSVESASPDSTDPEITFSTTQTGLVPRTFNFAGTATDTESPIDYIDWYIDGERGDGVGASSGTFGVDQSVEFDQDFSFDGSDKLTEGEHVFGLLVADTAGNTNFYEYNIDIDNGIPDCTADWTPMSSPVYDNEVSYQNVTCTDNRSITSANYRIYHGTEGEIEASVAITLPDDGVWGGTTEAVSFNYILNPALNLDGGVSITLRVIDEAGNIGYDYDSVVVEYNDNYAPTLSIDPVTPDPNTDNQPVLTGTCGDNRPFDTHTNISLIRYRVDGGSWVDITPIDGNYDSTLEIFSEELTGLSEAVHTVEVECTDGNSNTATQSDEFTLIPVDNDEQPDEFSHTDTFLNHTFQDTNSTSLIWGNGQLRLKEDITTTRTLLNGDYFGEEYGGEINDYDVQTDLLNSDYLWFSRLGNSSNQRGQILRYQISTGTTTPLDVAGITGQDLYELWDYQLQVVDGVQYMWISDSYRYFVINLNNLTGINGDLSMPMRRIAPDTRDNLGAYIVTDSAPGGKVNMVYIDLNDTLLNTGDDTVARPDTDVAGFTSADAQDIRFKAGTNYIYISHFGGKVYKLDDNNTPTNFADDTIDAYTGYENVFSGMTFDPDGNFIFGTAGNQNGRIFVVTDENSTPMDLSDDTLVQLNDPIDIEFNSVYGLHYLEGVDNVGDQLFIITENGTPYYMNFNNTYEDSLDDTFIKLEMANGWRGRWVNIFISDYDTVYASVRHDGFYRVELNRGWVDNGSAIGVPQRPPKKLVLDNFVADATVGDPIVAGVQEPIGSPVFGLFDLIIPKVKAQASGITYSISNDDGVTWTPITLNELEQLVPKDYRVKFRIEMAEQGGSTPLLEDYVINFAGYATEDQADETLALSAVATPSSVVVSQNFNFTVNALDTLGFTQSSYNENVTFTLLDASTDAVVTALNRYSAALSNGIVTFSDMKINATGVYKIRVSDGTLTTTSNNITVTAPAPSTPVPTLTFTSDKYSILKGESVELKWETTNITDADITPTIGDVEPNGTYTISLDETTKFTIVGTGPYGDLTANLTIEVVEVLPSYPAVGNTCVIEIEAAPDITVRPGEKVTIWWEVSECATEVFIDYLNSEVSTSGSFELYPLGDTTIVITASNGIDTVSKEIKISVSENTLIDILEDVPVGVIITLVGGSIALLLTSLLNLVNTGGRITFDTIVNVLRVIGFIPFKKRAGFVYQTVTSKGVAFATMNLLVNKKTITSIITDLNGGYYEPFLGRGEYTVDVNHPDHRFPTEYARPKALSIFDYYKGEGLVINDNKDKQALIVPLDLLKENQKSDKLSWAKVSLFINRVLVLLQLTIYPMLLVSAYFAINYPNLLNIVVFGIYLILVLMKLSKYLMIPTISLKIIEKDTNESLSDVFVVLRKKGEVVAVEKTNRSGKIKFFVPEDTYSVSIHREGYQVNAGFAEEIKITANKMNGMSVFYMNKYED